MRQSKHPEADRYELWRDAVPTDQGTFLIEATVISMGEHGAMEVSPSVRPAGAPGVSQSERKLAEGMLSDRRLEEVVVHNLFEFKRAIQEGSKWEIRLKRAPLGITTQDYVAYYTEVIALLAGWLTLHKVPLPGVGETQ